jgi:hypothetical protein
LFLTSLCLTNIVHVQTFVEECNSKFGGLGPHSRFRKQDTRSSTAISLLVRVCMIVLEIQYIYYSRHVISNYLGRVLAGNYGYRYAILARHTKKLQMGFTSRVTNEN